MSLEPRMFLPDTRARLDRKEALASRVSDSLTAAAAARAKKPIKDKKFEALHPRGPGGIFAKKAEKGGAKKLVTNKNLTYGSFVEDNNRTITEEKVRKGKKVDGISVEGSVYSTKSKNGKVLKMYDDELTPMSYEAKMQSLRTFADLHDAYPNFPTTVLLVRDIKRVSPENMHPQRDLIAAWVGLRVRKQISINGNNTVFQPDIFSDPITKRNPQTGENATTYPGIKVPSQSGLEVDAAKYVITHEFGHQYGNHVNREGYNNFVYGGATRGLFKNKKIKPHLSPYGHKNEMEAYAESFADWHTSKGKSKNPATVAYAAHEKWLGSREGVAGNSVKRAKKDLIGRLNKVITKTARSIYRKITPWDAENVVTFAAEEEVTAGEFDGPVILDTFDPETYSVLNEDQIQWQEATEEEVEWVEALVDAVFEELKDGDE